MKIFVNLMIAKSFDLLFWSHEIRPHDHFPLEGFKMEVFTVGVNCRCKLVVLVGRFLKKLTEYQYLATVCCIDDCLEQQFSNRGSQPFLGLLNII
jgi:hypothetical protein